MAINFIEKNISIWTKENPNQKVDEIVFDVYGFSRGCAAARHFANRVYNKDPALTKAIDQGFDSAKEVVKKTYGVRFLGVFDTVAAILPLSGLDFGGNVHDGQTGDVNITMPKGVAQKVTHLIANDECHYNFSSNDVLPNYKSLSIPGTHSDVGGGYHKDMKESMHLSDLYDYTDEKSEQEATAKAQKVLDAFRKRESWNYAADAPSARCRKRYYSKGQLKRVIATFHCD